MSAYPHYSTPINKSPPSQDSGAGAAQPVQKRPMKAPAQSSVTSKRAKPSETSGQNAKTKSPLRNEVEVGQEEEETDYIEGPPCFKMDGVELEEPKQFFERNGNGNFVETNAQDQGR